MSLLEELDPIKVSRLTRDANTASMAFINCESSSECDSNNACQLDSKDLRQKVSEAVSIWADVHDSLMEILVVRQLGFLDEKAMSVFDVLGITGVALHGILQKVDPTCDDVLDMAAALRALSVIRLSYQENPTNNVLETLTHRA